MPRISEKKAAAKSRVPRLPIRNEGWAKSSGSTIGRGWRRLRRRPRRRAAPGRRRRQPSVAGGAPAPVVALDDPERDQRQPERQHRGAGQVGQAAVADRPLGEATAAGEDDRQPERQVDEEDEPPVRELDQGAAEGRPDRRRGRRGRAPEADAGRAPLDREAVEDDRQRGRGDHRRADPLQDAEGDQQPERRRHRAEQARRGEAGDADQEDALVAEAVGEAAGRDEQGGDHDEVAVEHPGERVAPRAR